MRQNDLQCAVLRDKEDSKIGRKYINNTSTDIKTFPVCSWKYKTTADTSVKLHLETFSVLIMIQIQMCNMKAIAHTDEAKENNYQTMQLHRAF